MALKWSIARCYVVATFIVVVYSSGLYKREHCICTGSGLYLDTAKVMTLSNLHTMLIDKIMSGDLLNCVNSLITT